MRGCPCVWLHAERHYTILSVRLVQRLEYLFTKEQNVRVCPRLLLAHLGLVRI